MKRGDECTHIPTTLAVAAVELLPAFLVPHDLLECMGYPIVPRRIDLVYCVDRLVASVIKPVSTITSTSSSGTKKKDVAERRAHAHPLLLFAAYRPRPLYAE